MSKVTGTAMPEALFQRFRENEWRRFVGQGIVVVTVDEEGRPHPGILSYSEVTAVTRGDLRMAPWATSRMVGNVARDGKVSLIFADADLCCYLKGRAKVLKTRMDCDPSLAFIQIQVQQVLEDSPVESVEKGAHMLSGIAYSDPHMDDRIQRASCVIAELRAGQA
jgi:hypothetical protein